MSHQREKYCWLCSYPTEPCPWDCFNLEGRADDQLDLFEGNNEKPEEL